MDWSYVNCGNEKDQVMIYPQAQRRGSVDPGRSLKIFLSIQKDSF
jgi:hypothetical protein